MELLKLLSASEIFAQVASFLILLILLRAFAWKRLLGLLDRRKERIAAEFSKISADKSELSRLKAEYQAGLRSIDETAKARLEEAALKAQEMQGLARKDAYIEAQKIIENAKTNIRYEIDKAKEELKNEIVDLVVKAAGKVIEEKISDADDLRLAKGFVEDLEKLS